MTLRTLNYGNYGIFLIMGNAGFILSTVGAPKDRLGLPQKPLQVAGVFFGNLLRVVGLTK